MNVTFPAFLIGSVGPSLSKLTYFRNVVIFIIYAPLAYNLRDSMRQFTGYTKIRRQQKCQM